jgi:UDP-N-acetylglucosamine acyltransferase
MARIHATAIVESGAKLADDVEIGPYAVIGPQVHLDSGVTVAHHASILGSTRVGARTRIFPYALLGGEPQDKAFAGEATSLEIGRDNVIREHATIHLGTLPGGGCTRIGNENLIMNTAHIAHDCQIGSQCIIASFCGLAGHVTVEDHVVLGAYTGVHQFSRIGESVMAASNAKLSRDAPPFSMVAGDRARLVGVNSTGLRRRDFSKETVRAVKHAFHILFHSKLRLDTALARVREELGGTPEVSRLLCFLESSERGFCR